MIAERGPDLKAGERFGEIRAFSGLTLYREVWEEGTGAFRGYARAFDEEKRVRLEQKEAAENAPFLNRPQRIPNPDSDSTNLDYDGRGCIALLLAAFHEVPIISAIQRVGLEIIGNRRAA